MLGGHVAGGVRTWQLPGVPNVPGGHWQFGKVPTLPAGHFGAATQVLVAAE